MYVGWIWMWRTLIIIMKISVGSRKLLWPTIIISVIYLHVAHLPMHYLTCNAPILVYSTYKMCLEYLHQEFIDMWKGNCANALPYMTYMCSCWCTTLNLFFFLFNFLFLACDCACETMTIKVWRHTKLHVSLHQLSNYTRKHKEISMD